MAGISNNLLKLLNQKRELQVLADKSDKITSSIANIQNLVSEGILSQQDVDDILSEYKSSISTRVDRLLSDLEDQANNIAQTAVVESNDKAKNITTVITGTPVILPPPTTYALENSTILDIEEDINLQVTSLVNQIKSVIK